MIKNKTINNRERENVELFILITNSIKLRYRKNMKYYYIHLISLSLLLTLFSCVKNENKEKSLKSMASTIETNEKIQDTIFLIKKSTSEVSESSYYNKSVEYTPVIKNDTLNLNITLSELTSDSSIFIDIRTSSINDSIFISFKDKVHFLKKVLLLANSEFDISSTQTIHLGHLSSRSMFQTTLELSRDYINLYNPKKNITTKDYKQVVNFLNQSKLKVMLDNKLEDTNLEVETFKIEKAGLIPFESYSKWKWIKTPEDQLPKYLLMAMLWAKIKHKD